MQKKKIRRFYRNEQWNDFSNRVKKRDNYKCHKCYRNLQEVVLQVHHTIYHEEKKPWEYHLSDCITLCKGCHAREHDLIEPNYGWTLISINDLKGLDGICERKNCNTAIRYEHIAYHPKWGYKTVGSSCIEFLTEDDKFKSRQYIKFYQKISKILNRVSWEERKTKNLRKFIFIKYKKSIIMVYEDNSSYQICYLNKKENLEKSCQPFKRKILELEFIQELAVVHLLRRIAKENKKIEEYQAIQNIFENTKESML